MTHFELKDARRVALHVAGEQLRQAQNKVARARRALKNCGIARQSQCKLALETAKLDLASARSRYRGL